MSTRFIGVESASGMGDTWPVAVPSGVLPDDFLFFGAVAATPYGFDLPQGSLLYPGGWVKEPDANVVGQTNFVALRYAGDAEPGLYTFGFTLPVPWVAFIAAYRGVQRDLAYDPVNYPDGYYAPRGSAGGNRGQVSVNHVATPIGAASTVDFARAWLLLGGTHASATPHFFDVSPAVSQRAKVQTAQVSAMLCDVELPAAGAAGPWTVFADLVLSGSIGSARLLEPVLAASDSLDTYKAKLLRRSMPPPLKKTWGSNVGKLLTAIGGSDNEIGGLVGIADFLPDEV